MNRVELFSVAQRLACRDVREIMDLSGGDASNSSMAQLQEAGVTALYNILCEQPFAYLADEVGTGKTYQALALAALVWYIKPDAKILFVAPRENVQNDWVTAFNRFFRNNYMRASGGDDRVTSLLLGKPLHGPVKMENLREWIVSLNRPQRVAAILRHTSFMLPIKVPKNKTLREVWDDWRSRFSACGLHSLPYLLPTRRADEASAAFGKEIARAINGMLHDKDVAFDLVIVDEAQCLRYPDNQSNTNLFDVLKGRVHKWLFMSATPAHSSEDDIPRVLNHYPGRRGMISWKRGDDVQELQRQLQSFMVRRPRAYDVKGTRYTKDLYREDRVEDWAENCTGALHTLAMGLVQKHLIPVLQKRSYRYQVGFLSNFESLQSSVRSLESSAQEGAADSDASDYFHDKNARRTKENIQAPDSGFIDKLDSDFKSRFDIHLPHPKVDRIVRDLSALAFGVGESDGGGRKALVFARRISTVETITARLSDVYHETVKARMKRYWGGRDLDWETGFDSGASASGAKAAGRQPAPAQKGNVEGPLRLAMQESNWLGQFRRTFHGSGRHATFFEENWLRRLCSAGGTDPEAVADALRDDLWHESLTYAQRDAGSKTSFDRVKQIEYIAFHALGDADAYRCFGLDAQAARHWRELLVQILPDIVTRRVEAFDASRASRYPMLFKERTLWTEWDAHFSQEPLALPGGEAMPDPHAFYLRQVLKTILGQIMRSTDTLLDLKCADLEGDMAKVFLTWLASEDCDAIALRQQYADWIAHCPLILDSGLGITEPLAQLAKRTHFEQLNNREPVVGVTGGSVNKRAIEQFRTPGHPLVIVCTDTLKEGVNLHLFCDKVVHYGLAWTSGDLEQRIGRVDRYFSQIERRLANESSPKLHVYYPHIRNSLERSQVLEVIARKQRAEKLMDSPLVSGQKEEQSISTESTVPQEVEAEQEIDRDFFSGKRHLGAGSTAVIDGQVQRLVARKDAYRIWTRRFRACVEAVGVTIDGDPEAFDTPFFAQTEDGRYQVSWGLDPDLGRYLFRLEAQPVDSRSRKGRERIDWDGEGATGAGHQVLLLPDSPTEPVEPYASAFVTQLRRTSAQYRAALPWDDISDVVTESADGEGRWQVRTNFGSRSQTVTVELREGLTMASAQIIDAHTLPGREPWGDNGMTTREWLIAESQQLPSGALDLDPEGNLIYTSEIAFPHAHTADVAQDICRFVRVVGWRANIYRTAIRPGA